MPIPVIIIWGIAVLATTIAATIVAINWEKIVIKFLGKNLVILGAKGTGKTTIHNFLREGVITEKHSATRRKKVPAKTYKLEDSKMEEIRASISEALKNMDLE